MRWEELSLTEIELNKRTMMECENEKPCSVCGSPTRYIDYCYESRMCSEECQHKTDEWANGDYIGNLE